MLFQGQAISVSVNDQIAKLVFDLKNESVNKLNALTLNELDQALSAIEKEQSIKALLLASAKDVFIVGADITEFGEMAQQDEESLAAQIYGIDEIFNRIEDLDMPVVAAINGYALGGGLEVCLTADYRVLADSAKVGFPEVKLGIIPGYGGTVRTPRIIGVDNAVEWIAAGKEYRADAALTVGIVDAVVPTEQVEAAALALIDDCLKGDFDYQARKQEKRDPLKLDDIEAIMAFVTGKAAVAQQASRHMPAPMKSVSTIEKHAKLGRDEALKVESQTIAKLAKSEVTKNLVSLFLGDQLLTKNAKTAAKAVQPVQRAAVLGAGIMGGGIAYQSAYRGTPIVMKDIAQEGIDAGLKEAGSLLAKRVDRGRMSAGEMAAVLNKIDPALSYDGFDKVDFVVEAVVENPKVKKMVLAQVEGLVGDDVVLSSNTSTIPITELASALKRPENFCGMHFFNPVHKMPLVEIIRGEKTSEATIAKTVSYALALGKKPVVVNDGPGFLVNRILFAYFAGFAQLLHEGADFVKVDKVAEAFGWPMGPAFLSDVVGIDTAVHAHEVMAEGFPDRMGSDFKTGMKVMYENNRLGQKNGIGFYQYVPDKKGRPQKTFDETVWNLLKNDVAPRKDFSDEEILDRLMVPFCLEAIRCLEDNIAATPSDLDMALIFGVGFPVFRGGALHYVDNMGLANFVAKAEQYASLGALYAPTEKLKAMAANNESFH